MIKKRKNFKEKGRYSYEGLDRIMHEKARLSILTSLLTRSDGLLFGDLRELCALTDGNLSRHVKVLEEEGLVSVEKSFYRNRPQTLCCLTEVGRDRFLAYLQELEQVVRDAATAAKSHKKPGNIGGLATV
ncbi:transcriptional regulator [Candidatus Parabeggiatoa sp. HSG14]|uniref:transcriptional regulator n=1 Tax=Candidatus Parabeggiatoa sp. HSG14 TaxID=3055593 RepID=UPI0025A6F487|nr:transcriptional regulator [Thiotrichales bacterium HSG14]